MTSNIEKSIILKQQILALCVKGGDTSIAEFSKELNVSIPTVTKLVEELIEEGRMVDLGKSDASGGRRPSIYGLNPSAGYIIGADVRRTHVSLAAADFQGNIINYRNDVLFTLENSAESFRAFCEFLKEYTASLNIPKDKVLAYGVNLSGRIDKDSGYSFSHYIEENKPVVATLEKMLEAPVFIENDSRAMAYGEYLCGDVGEAKEMLYINVSWGLGMGMIIDGKLMYGKSGFCGEIGHFPFFDNGHICHCGKVGCLETVASGSAVYRNVMEKLEEGKASVLSEKYNTGSEITLDDILDALKEEDVLVIEAVEEIGVSLGRAIAGLINIFNPGVVVIGGWMSVAKEYLLLPVRSAINKYSVSAVRKDSSVKFSKLGRKAGPIGACMLSRSKLLGLV